MDFSLDVLRSFVAVAEGGSFTAAGKRVNRTQSAISVQIKRLEEELGQRLFRRQARGVELTSHGRTLLGYAQRMVRLQQEALESLSKPHISGRVRIGAPENYATCLLPDVLEAFSKAHPLVRIDVVCDSSRVLVGSLSSGELDLVLNTSVAPTAGELLFVDPIVWVCAASSDAWLEEPVPLAVLHHGCFYRQWAIEALERERRAYRLAYMSPSMTGIMGAVQSGLGVSPVARSTVADWARILGPEQGYPGLPGGYVTLEYAEHPDPVVACLSEYIRKAI